MTVFTKIIEGTVPAYKIAEDEHYLAFLDINPNTKGHTLCIPKKETDQLFDMDSDEYLGLMKFSRRVAKALKGAVPCKRVGMAVVGLEVPHAHVHLIPINDMDDMRFTRKVLLTDQEFEDTVARIREELLLH